jgi:hypothetical protein
VTVIAGVSALASAGALQMVLVGADHRYDRIFHHIAGRDPVIPPHVALKRKFPRRIRIELVVVGESDESVQVALLSALEAADREAAAARDGLLVIRQPDQAGVIAVVVDFQRDRHGSPSVAGGAAYSDK